MAPPSITITIGIGATGILGEVDVAAEAVQITPAVQFDAVLTVDTIEITVLEPPVYAGSYSVLRSALETGPVSLVSPALSAANVAAGDTLTVTAGLWAADTAFPPAAITRQWLRDGADIPGAAGLAYPVQPADAGSLLSLRETASQSGSGTRSATSGTATVAQPAGRTVVFSLIGQSNMVGWDAFDGGGDYPAGVMQMDRTGSLVQAVHLLDHHDGSPGDMGPALQFAIDWTAANPGDTLVLVPDARSSTGFATGDWNPGQTLYASAVTRLNTLFADYPEFELGGFLWHQGESDALTATDAAAYAAALDAMITQMRTDVTAAGAATPFVVGGMVPSWVVGAAERQVVQDALSGTPGRIAHSAFADGAGLNAGPDSIHFNAASLRILGSRYHAALDAAAANTGDPWQIAGAVIQSFPAVPVPSVSGTTVTAGA